MPLSDTQAVILNAAAQRDDRLALPLPASLKGGAAQKVVASMVNKGLLKEVDIKRGQTCWSQTADGDGRTLIVTDAGLAAIGIEPDESCEPEQPEAPQTATGADTGATAETADKDASEADAAPTAAVDDKTPKIRQGTKQSVLIAMLKSADGATIEEVMAATGWQSHTVRGAIAGALKKRLGLTVTSEKVDGRGRVYRLPVA